MPERQELVRMLFIVNDKIASLRLSTQDSEENLK